MFKKPALKTKLYSDKPGQSQFFVTPGVSKLKENTALLKKSNIFGSGTSSLTSPSINTTANASEDKEETKCCGITCTIL